MFLHPLHIFPHIKEGKAINLDGWLQQRYRDLDPRDPKKLTEAIADLPYMTYGGYLEDRSFMWKNTYLAETGNFIHLGIDINVRKNTPVMLPFATTVVQAWADPETEIGWGGRLTLQRGEDEPLIILAHLDPKSLPKEGDYLAKNYPFARVGTYPENGNVFEHLHIQILWADFFPELATIDGYGKAEDAKKCPNPFAIDL